MVGLTTGRRCCKSSTSCSIVDRQLIGDLAVKSWLEDVTDLAYNLEDLLDEFTTEAAKQEPGPESSTSGSLRK